MVGSQARLFAMGAEVVSLLSPKGDIKTFYQRKKNYLLNLY
jgi:hypothetical protein